MKAHADKYSMEWQESNWYQEWLRLAEESNAHSPKREGEWVAFFTESDELVYKYVKYDT